MAWDCFAVADALDLLVDVLMEPSELDTHLERLEHLPRVVPLAGKPM